MKKKMFMGIIILVVVGIMLIFVAWITSGITVDPNNYVNLENGWDIQIGDDISFTNANITDVSFPVVDRGDVLIMQRVIPETHVQTPILEVVAVHAAVEIFLDDDMVYTYGMDRLDKKSVMGYGYHRFTLPEDYANKLLTIKMYVDEDNSFSSLTTPRICNGETCVRDYIYENRIPLVVNIFLIMFGLTVGIISGICMIYQRGLIKLFSTSLFALFIGLWSFANYNLLVIFTDDMVIKSWVEFAALYIAPIFMLLYFWTESTHHVTLFRKLCYVFLLAAQTTYAVVSIVGQATGLFHMHSVLTIDHILLVLVVIYVFVACLADIIHGKTENITLFIGAIVMVIFVAWDLLSYYIQKYIHLFGNGDYYEGVTCMGTMVFVIAMLISFFYEIVDGMYHSVEQDTLEKMVYTDAMTGLANRRRCEDMFDELDNGDFDYELIEFDLNNLKQVNDTLGHETGDEFITAFASILASVFGSTGLVARTGGDEFLVIVKDEKMLDLPVAIEALEREISNKNAEYPGWSMSTAYGASSRKGDGVSRARDAYKKADERMYNNKSMMKQGRK